MAHTGNVRSNGVAHHPAPRPRAKKREREYLYAKGPVGSMCTLIERASARLKKQTLRAKAYGLPENLHIVTNLGSAVEALEEAVVGLRNVPDDWRPARGSIGGANPIEEGSSVVLKKEKRSFHDVELFDTTVVMHVSRIAGGKVVCNVRDGKDKGTRLVIPRTHLEMVTES